MPTIHHVIIETAYIVGPIINVLRTSMAHTILLERMNWKNGHYCQNYFISGISRVCPIDCRTQQSNTLDHHMATNERETTWGRHCTLANDINKEKNQVFKQHYYYFTRVHEEVQNTLGEKWQKQWVASSTESWGGAVPNQRSLLGRYGQRMPIKQQQMGIWYNCLM